MSTSTQKRRKEWLEQKDSNSDDKQKQLRIA